MTNITEVSASFQRTHELCGVVIGALAGSGSEVGYGVLACGLAIGRLYTTDKNMTDSEEVKFIEDLMDWVGAYFTPIGEKN